MASAAKLGRGAGGLHRAAPGASWIVLALSASSVAVDAASALMLAGVPVRGWQLASDGFVVRSGSGASFDGASPSPLAMLATGARTELGAGAHLTASSGGASAADWGGSGGSGGSGSFGGSGQPPAPSDIDPGRGGASQEVVLEEVAPSHKQEAFCNGEASSMHMTGFTSVLFDAHRSQQECPVFLRAAWVLDTPVKFAVGCIVATALGAAVEALLRLQQVACVQASHIGFKLLLYAMGLALGYILMLLVMVYSVELTFCVVAGLVGGRGLYLSMASGGEKAEGTGPTPCCSTVTA